MTGSQANGGNLEDSDSLCRYAERPWEVERLLRAAPTQTRVQCLMTLGCVWELMSRRKDPAISFLRPVVVSRDGPRF